MRTKYFIPSLMLGFILILGSCSEERKTWYIPPEQDPEEEPDESLADWAPTVPITYYGNCHGENPDGRPMYPWWGEHMVLLSYEADLEPSAMKKWVDAADTIYEFYLKCTGGRTPWIDSSCYINDRICLAATHGLPAAAEAWVGGTGIWMNSINFEGVYNSYKNGYQDGLTPYEMGRNFWMFGSKITYGTDEPECTGYSNFMARMATVEILDQTFSNPETDPTWNIDKLFDIYMSNPNNTYENTIAVERGIDNPYGQGATDLFACFLFELQERYGGLDWVVKFWNYVSQRPDAASEQTAVDNLIVAASQAAGKSLCDLFEEWRWPVSQNARAAVQALGLL